MPILRMTGGKTLTVSEKKAKEILLWKNEKKMEGTKLVDVGLENYIALSEIKGVLREEDYISKQEDNRIDIDDPEEREKVKMFERRLEGKSHFDFGIENKLIIDKSFEGERGKLFHYSVNKEHFLEWKEVLKLASALSELRYRREYARKQEESAQESLLQEPLTN